MDWVRLKIWRKSSHGDVVFRARKFRNNPGKTYRSFKKTYAKRLQFNTVIGSLNIVFIGMNIDFVISRFKAN